MYIDDLVAFPYPADALINYNIFSTSEDYKKLYKESNVEIPQLIIGPYYAPLRTMFRNIPPRIQRKRVNDVLISTGGSDPEHLALRLVEEVNRRTTDIIYHILLGNMNEDKDLVKKSAGESIVIHENVFDMKSLICSCDMAVSAAGSTMYEICACGVPLITYILADNQIPGADAFEKYGLAENLGDLRNINSPAEIIISSVERLSKDYNARIEVGKHMQRMVDGFGADRIIQKIISDNQGFI